MSRWGVASIILLVSAWLYQCWQQHLLVEKHKEEIEHWREANRQKDQLISSQGSKLSDQANKLEWIKGSALDTSKTCISQLRRSVGVSNQYGHLVESLIEKLIDRTAEATFNQATYEVLKLTLTNHLKEQHPESEVLKPDTFQWKKLQ